MTAKEAARVGRGKDVLTVADLTRLKAIVDLHGHRLREHAQGYILKGGASEHGGSRA